MRSEYTGAYVRDTGILSISSLSGVSSRSIAGRLLRLPLRLLPRRLVVRVRSGLNKGARWIVGSSIHGCWLGHYEADKQALVRTLVRPGMRIFDVGANAGFYTLAFSRLVGAKGHVWAFEPFAENAANILRHVELNGIDNVTLIQSAVADRRGVAGFKVGPNNAQGMLSEQPNNYLVPTSTLDDLIAQDIAQSPDLVKMDVEGAESLVLEGAAQLLAAQRTTFLIALHGDTQMRRCVNALCDAGYQVFHLDGTPVRADSTFTDEIYARPAVPSPAIEAT